MRLYPNAILCYRYRFRYDPGSDPNLQGISMTELSSSQRKELRSLAHHLDPLVLVGAKGVTETLIRSVRDSLEAHELIKIKFNEHKDEKKTLIEQIAESTESAVVGTIGHVAILYREHPTPEKRRIKLKSS
jgi:RNA-binding protein